MGRSSVRLKINSTELEKFATEHGFWTQIAEKLGVTKQAVSNWLSDGLIPPRALYEIARELKIPSESLDVILIGGKLEDRKPFKIHITVEIE